MLYARRVQPGYGDATHDRADWADAAIAFGYRRERYSIARQQTLSRIQGLDYLMIVARDRCPHRLTRCRRYT